jgi:hypothetical protein
MRNKGTYGKGSKGKADRLLSLVVRSRGICAACGETDYSKLQCAHIVPRTFSATRTDETNCFALDWKCHRRFTDNPFEWVSFVERTIGRVEYERLMRKARDGVGTKVDWDAEVARLAEVWKSIEEKAA